MNFSELGLHEALLKAVSEQDYTTPTPIQAQAIPAILQGRDIMASAQTGTGKTAGFTLPLLNKLASEPQANSNRTLALVLTPTRELAAQVHESIETYGKYLPIRSAVVFGGVKINPQMMKLRRGVEILVATPGRLLDLFQQNAIKFDDISTLVLDEADRMLDMGFINDIKKILSRLPKERQNLLFSATFSPEIQKLAKSLLNDPVEVSVAPLNTATELVQQSLYLVDKPRKTELLKTLIKNEGWYQALVFSRTKHGANKLVKQLEDDGIHAAAIHGNKSQAHRTKVLERFKEGKLQILVATDIAARGIDIDQLPQVVNYDLPQVAEDYVHRIGRTGRAGADGKAISLVCAEENKLLKAIEKLLKRDIDRVTMEGFESTEDFSKSYPSPQRTNQRNRRNQDQRPKRNNPRADGRRKEGRVEAKRGTARSGAARNTAPRMEMPASRLSAVDAERALQANGNRIAPPPEKAGKRNERSEGPRKPKSRPRRQGAGRSQTSSSGATLLYRS
ncbi:MAG: DEAD/DEAH box helicase [Pseudohongiellaceae bacterium]|nr:DEAD/DEAH box helicase [Pseudohongiellaceae bacterium]